MEEPKKTDPQTGRADFVAELTAPCTSTIINRKDRNMTMPKTQLPKIQIPDLEQVMEKHPGKVGAIHAVGFIAYDPDSRVAFLFIESSKQWIITTNISEADMMARARLIAESAYRGRSDDGGKVH